MIVHRRLVRLAGQVTGQVAACAGLGLAVSAAYVGQAVLLAAALAEVARGRPDAAVTPLAWAFAVIAGRAALLWARETVTVWAGALIRARLRDRLVARLGELGPAYLTGTRTGRAQTTLVDGVEGLDAYFSRYLPQVVVTFCVPVALVAWLATIDATAGAVLGAAVAGVLVIPRLWDVTLLRRGRERWAAFAELASDHLEAMQGMATLRAFGAAGRLGARLAGRAHDLYLTTMRQLRVSLVETGVSAFLVQAGTAGAALVAAGGRLDAREAFTVLLVAVECFRPVRNLSEYWHAGYLGVSAVDGLGELLTAEPAVRDTGRRADIPRHAPRVRFEHVTFTYPGRDRPAVHDLSLTIEPGETVALVGPSGAGKSTCAALLQRHVDPGAGRITLDGTDLREWRLDALRAGIAVVAQDTYLFHGTVADNLRLARPGATDEELVAACAAAGAHEFVAALPAGYETRLGERGGTLSGGQRQRLALARALLADAPVLVLDEATSHVDPRAEAAIAQALARARRGRTCLVIAHRLSAVRDADRIVVLADGAVAESGGHDDLLAAAGPYTRLVAAQELPA
ncbi:ABC transporter ATP-binding protein/permease [Bailinhaonella thermotolerans]|uniref:ABC transporter ATP-binding protein n=1 Tax=Bailinhaonella thermotolerans TaxID=1070861 RepID=A0A3A4A873_9ACTN|nr:ABC transporter ATP-binding protein [Bailinhaonella thermotolerans]RJL24231.1 ABC transporter ATP-binding protein [Bailinhaonella thermotolerans]